MIVELTVENLAIIERAQLSLGPGLTVLTGETGAGKSLLIDAIELALGERADTELVRTGAARASVSLAIDLSHEPALAARCEELGFPLDDAMLYIQRDVAAEGRSQCRIGGKLTPVSALRQLGGLLVDLHGQHEHQSLLDAGRHSDHLDDWIGEPVRVCLAEVARCHASAEEARRRLAALRASLRDREHRLDLLRFQVNEIESVSPQEGEMEDLEARLSRLKHAEKLANAAFAALGQLADEDRSAVDLAGSAAKALEDSVRYDPGLEAIALPVREAFYVLEEASHALRAYAEGLDSDPTTLDEAGNRLEALRRLRRKYGEDESAVLAFLGKARDELALLEDGEAGEADLTAAVEASERDLAEAAARLTSLRTQRAGEFAHKVTEQLRDLAMDRAEFQVAFKPRPPDARGADDIEFVFSANAGEPPRPLARIASGGEISRVMLALKSASSGRAGVPTLVFDEVDAGLGGRVAATVARKLQELAEHRQVVVISHLPQIAARAAVHHRIEKGEAGGRVTTQVRELDAPARVEEVARMLAGEQVTDAARAHAVELIAGG